MATFAERAETALGEALLEEDTIERYSLNRYAELLIGLAKIELYEREVKALEKLASAQAYGIRTLQ